MISIQTCLGSWRQLLRRLCADPRVLWAAQLGIWFAGGFGFSAASVADAMQPLSMALIWVSTGRGCLPAAAGAMLGYWCFWPADAAQGLVWAALGLLGKLLTGSCLREQPMLPPAAAALAVAATGVGFQLFGADATPVGTYLIRIGLAAGSVWVFARVLEGRSPVLEWVAWALGVLALAQIMPLPYCNLGFIAAGILAVSQSFPGAALAGLALDLAQVTTIPMTAVLVLAALIRFLPRQPKWLPPWIPACVYLLLMRLRAGWDLMPLVGLLAGGVIGSHVKGPAKIQHRRGQTGVAQVRLEIAAGVLAQTQLLLMDVQSVPVDEDALVARAADRACGSCPARHSCKDTRRIAQLPGMLLQKPLLHPEELPVLCRKSGRFLAELHRSQEQLRSIRADRERQQEYRAAVLQQYQFLSEFLQDLSDHLSDSPRQLQPFYAPQVQIYGNRPQADNGDRVLEFTGAMCKHYVVLCDGMGTGMGAVQDGRTAAGMLRSLLTAGFPAEYALRSINSLCALRDRAGAVTMDLAEIELYSGKVLLYKWGAAPSYVISATGTGKIGWTSPPPGLAVEQEREQVHTLSLRRNQTLLMVSDGVAEEAVQQCCKNHADRSPGELARSILTCSRVQGQDDATVIAIRLGLSGEKV